jgi:hypothetical protein
VFNLTSKTGEAASQTSTKTSEASSAQDGGEKRVGGGEDLTQTSHLALAVGTTTLKDGNLVGTGLKTQIIIIIILTKY